MIASRALPSLSLACAAADLMDKGALMSERLGSAVSPARRSVLAAARRSRAGETRSAYARLVRDPSVAAAPSRGRCPARCTSSSCVPICASRPFSSTRITSARRSRLSRLATTNVVRPAIAWRSADTISCSVFGSTDAVGSSRIRIGGCSSSARASASRCRWPPERSTPDSPSTVS